MNYQFKERGNKWMESNRWKEKTKLKNKKTRNLIKFIEPNKNIKNSTKENQNHIDEKTKEKQPLRKNIKNLFESYLIEEKEQKLSKRRRSVSATKNIVLDFHKTVKINFSFKLEILGQNSEKYFSNFKKFLDNQTEIEEINDNLLESEKLLDLTKKYIEYTEKRKDLQENSKENYLTTLRSFFSKIIENQSIKLENKTYLKLSYNHLKSANKKNKINRENKKKSPQKKTFNYFSFSFESLGKNYEKKFSKFKNFVQVEMKNLIINDKFLESYVLLDCTEKYIAYIENKNEILTKSKKDYFSELKKFFLKIVEKDEIFLYKKYLHLSAVQLEIAKQKYLQKMSLEQKDSKKVKKVKKKFFIFKFSFSLESLGNYSDQYFIRFRNFIEKETKIERLNDQFLESQSLLDCTKKYLHFVVNMDDIRLESKLNCISNLKSVFERIIANKFIKIEKKFLKLSVDCIDRFVVDDSNFKKREKKKPEKNKKRKIIPHDSDSATPNKENEKNSNKKQKTTKKKIVVEKQNEKVDQDLVVIEKEIKLVDYELQLVEKELEILRLLKEKNHIELQILNQKKNNK